MNLIKRMKQTLEEQIIERQKQILEETKLPKQVYAKDLLNERKNDKLKIAELEIKLKNTEKIINDLISKNNYNEKLTDSLRKDLVDKMKYTNLLLDVLGTQLVENSNQTNEINRLLQITSEYDINFIQKLIKKYGKDSTKTI